jgi:Fur family peroxide stress response transcriptional regulator
LQVRKFLIKVSAVTKAEDHAAKMIERLRRAGLKLTPQRLAIVRELADDLTHPTAQELFERLKASMPTMSFATVYNTLDALAASGLCAARTLAPGATRFDPNTEPHHHAVCDECGAIFDLPAEATRSHDAGGSSAARTSHARGSVAVERGAPGFVVRAVEQIYRGVCASCAVSRGARRRAKQGSSAPS